MMLFRKPKADYQWAKYVLVQPYLTAALGPFDTKALAQQFKEDHEVYKDGVIVPLFPQKEPKT